MEIYFHLDRATNYIDMYLYNRVLLNNGWLFLLKRSRSSDSSSFLSIKER